MAFLCPVRMRRGKKKKENNDKLSTPPSIGRITGSASIETLVRVGIEKEHGLSPDSKMVVLHDFQPCVDDELEVRRGQLVNVLYQENDWVYVIAADNHSEGFIPHSYCAPVESHLAALAMNIKHKKMPRSIAGGEYDNYGLSGGGGGGGSGFGGTVCGDQLSIAKSAGTGGGGSGGTHIGGNQSEFECFQVHMLGGGSGAECHPFFKDPAGRYIVLYTFIARDENDVSVERGEFVTVLNRDDPDWYWVVRCDGQEGFIPSGFVCPADMIHGHSNGQSNTNTGNNNNVGHHNTTAHIGIVGNGSGGGGGGLVTGMGSGSVGPVMNGSTTSGTGGGGGGQAPAGDQSEPRFHGTELVMLYDYKAQASDDLSVRRGDWVYADLNVQNVDGWLWAFAPKHRKYGFIPKAYARPPAMTSL